MNTTDLSATKGPRSLLFSVYDQLRGGKVKKHLTELKELSRTGNEAEIEERHRNLFQELMKEVSEHVPAYRRYSGSTRLSDMPVLKKDVLKANYNQYFSNRYKRDDLIEAKTSGSYGTPFSFYMTKDRKARQQAEIIHFGKLSGYEVGQKHAYVRSTVKSSLKLWLQNELLISPSIVNEKFLSEKRKKLIESECELIIGYPTVIANIASYCLSVGDTPSIFSVKGVITTSEPLTEQARATIENCFGVKVLSRYSSEELGVVGQERSEPGLHLTNHFTHMVEVLELNSDKRCEPGKVGRVVVTDLYNRAFPLIRYDTGDLAEYVPASKNRYGVPAIKNLQGRTIEVIYTVKGETITPMAINGVFRDCEDSDNIIQYQFIQESSSDYSLLLQLVKEELDTLPIIENLKSMLGSDANIKIDFVDHIPPLKSGKRPYIVNRYKK